MLQEFENLLKSVDLVAYRAQYNPVKIVEMDMPKNIQAIKSLYDVYWMRKEFVNFEAFYKIYLDIHKENIELFRMKTTMCRDCYYRGLPARIYRTWASIITQIHAGYVAESVFGVGTVAMSEELDHKGADFQVTYRDNILNYQVKKTSFSREIRQSKKAGATLPGKFIDINYEVPNFEHILHPKRIDGKGYYKDYLEFKKVLDAGYEKLLPTGFVVFTPKLFEEEKLLIDNSLK